MWWSVRNSDEWTSNNLKRVVSSFLCTNRDAILAKGVSSLNDEKKKFSVLVSYDQSAGDFLWLFLG